MLFFHGLYFFHNFFEIFSPSNLKMNVQEILFPHFPHLFWSISPLVIKKRKKKVYRLISPCIRMIFPVENKMLDIEQLSFQNDERKHKWSCVRTALSLFWTREGNQGAYQEYLCPYGNTVALFRDLRWFIVCGINCHFDGWYLYSYQVWVLTKCQWTVGAWLRIFLNCSFLFWIAHSNNKEVDEMYEWAVIVLVCLGERR